MDESTIEKNNTLVKNDSYLRFPKIGKWISVVLVIVMLAGAAVWLRFGVYTKNIEGVCVTHERAAIFLVPLDRAFTVSEGDTIWVSGEKGTVSAIFRDMYYTKETVTTTPYFAGCDLTLLDDEMTYVIGRAEFENPIAEANRYRIVVETESAMDHFFGGAMQ